MKNLKKVLKEKQNILSIYYTAGYPNLNDTADIIMNLQKYGADIIEVGIPYSDPPADGETIQKSSSIALKNGINLDVVFEQLKSVKEDVKVPLIIMGYLNQMIVYGTVRFLSACREAGVQSLIIPDLPLEEYEEQYKETFKNFGLRNIFLITPQTSEERIRKIDELSEGFIYMVSSSSITGGSKSFSQEQEDYFKRISDMKLKNPCLIGFGISNQETFDKACKYSAGAIIGSAFIKALSGNGKQEESIKNFIGSIKETK